MDGEQMSNNASNESMILRIRVSDLLGIRFMDWPSFGEGRRFESKVILIYQGFSDERARRRTAVPLSTPMGGRVTEKVPSCTAATFALSK